MTIKKISVDRLQPGMFVHDLNWSANSGHLVHGRFSVADEPQIESLRELGVRELYIDTLLGDDAREAPSMQDVRSGLEAQLLEIGQGAENNFFRDFGEEIDNARGVHESATLFVGNLMRQVRTGALEDVGHELLDLAQGLNHSVSRNPHALISLAQVRSKDDYTFLHSVGSAILMTAMEPVEVILKLLEWSGQHLNGELVQHFIRTVGAFPNGTLVRLASGRLAQVVSQGAGGGVRPVVRMIYDTASRREITSPAIDLSGGVEDDTIVGWESWEKWGLTPTPLRV